jgi:single-strand DNA-binding protein
VRGKERRSNFFRAPPRKHSLALGSRALSLGFAYCDPSRIREFNKTEITIMYSNKVTLIGFLGNDAEVRSNDNRNLTILSLATKSSYKKDGKYIEHTEWHRSIAFGKLGEFAATLKKGAHIQIEGELRSRKYMSSKSNSEQTVWEIRVNSILKLDRAAKSTAEEQEQDDAREDEASA